MVMERAPVVQMEALKQTELREAQGPIDPGTGWGGLPEGIMGHVLTHLDVPALKRVRLVSDHWRYAADRNLQVCTATP